MVFGTVYSITFVRHVNGIQADEYMRVQNMKYTLGFSKKQLTNLI